jgi:SPP1 family predicted phage head-tail adaptor
MAKLPRRSSVRAGALRHRVLLQRAVVVRKPDGSFEEQFQPVGEYWANVDSFRGGENFEDNMIEAQRMSRVRLRGGLDIREKDRFLWRGRVLNVEAVVDRDGRGVLQELLCGETIGEEVAPPVVVPVVPALPHFLVHRLV